MNVSVNVFQGPMTMGDRAGTKPKAAGKATGRGRKRSAASVAPSDPSTGEPVTGEGDDDDKGVDVVKGCVNPADDLVSTASPKRGPSSAAQGKRGRQKKAAEGGLSDGIEAKSANMAAAEAGGSEDPGGDGNNEALQAAKGAAKRRRQTPVKVAATAKASLEPPPVLGEDRKVSA